MASASTVVTAGASSVLIGSVVGVVLFLACVCLIGNYYVVEFKQQSAMEKWNAYSDATVNHSRASMGQMQPDDDIETQSIENLYGARDSHAEFERDVFSPQKNSQSRPVGAGDSGVVQKVTRRMSALGMAAMGAAPLPPPAPTPMADSMELMQVSVTQEGGNKYVNNPLLSNPALLQRSTSGKERTSSNDNSRAPHTQFGAAADTGRSRAGTATSDFARRALNRSSVAGPGTKGYVQGKYLHCSCHYRYYYYYYYY